jgi:hypothetical protein
VRRGAAILALLVLAVSTAACGQRYERRTGRATLERAMSRAFKRHYAAAYRMSTGRAFRLVIRHADVRCKRRGDQPADDSTPWPWACRVRYYTRRDFRPHIATYGVNVNDRGCFEARSGAFLDRLPERVLGDRLEADPLLYIRSCP